LKSYGDIDSKFRFVILATKRAKELLGGAKPKIKSKSKNPIRIAQNEVSQGLIDFEIIQPKEEEKVAPEEGVFIGEEVKEEVKVKEEKKVTKEKKIEIEEKKGEKKKAEKKAERKVELKAEEKPKAAKKKKKK
jgi:DNA-directed RNA polymerase omega subunit